MHKRISSFILRKVVKDASEIIGEPIEDVVITCPAYFGINQREATCTGGCDRRAERAGHHQRADRGRHRLRHAPAEGLLQAGAPLKSLLSDSDIELLVDYDVEPPHWRLRLPRRIATSIGFSKP